MPKLNIHNPVTIPIVATLIVLVLLYTTACSYYKAVSEDSSQLAKDELYADLSAYQTYIHDTTDVFLLTDCELDSTRLTGKIHFVDSLTAPFYASDNASTRVKGDNRSILEEIHFYTEPAVSLVQSAESSELISLSTSEIHEVKLIKLNVTKSIFIGLAVLLGIAVIAFGIFLIVLALTSCPYVYVFDGNEFVFQGEIYSGANARNLERSDVLHLPAIKESDDKYTVRISNELKEKQFINHMRLAVVEHSPNALVVPDQSGNYHIIRSYSEPIECYTHLGSDISRAVATVDTSYFLFDEPDSNGTTVNITFSNSTAAGSGVLLLDVKNSVWGDHIVGEFQSLFGRRYKYWNKSREKLTYEERMANLDSSSLLLSIYLEQDGSWKFVENLQFVGPMAERTVAVPLDFSPETSDIKIKLYCGYRFWELNQVSMSFDTDRLPPEDIHYPDMVEVPDDIRDTADVN